MVRLATLCAFYGLVITLFCSGALAASAAQKEGKILAQRVYDRPNGRDISSKAVMILTEKGHRPRRRDLFTYTLDKGKGEKWSLSRFTKPADIDGTGLLTLDFPGDRSDQWLYLPALDRVRRISSSRKGGRFMGSDLFYEDMQDREVDMDTHRLLGKRKTGGLVCDVLISKPIDADNSVYTKRISWVHPKTLIPLRIDLYQKGRKKPVKRLKVHKIKKIQGYWTVMQSTMYDLKTKHKTRLITKSIKYDQGLPDALFSRQVLADDSRERRYRP